MQTPLWTGSVSACKSFVWISPKKGEITNNQNQVQNHPEIAPPQGGSEEPALLFLMLLR